MSLPSWLVRSEASAIGKLGASRYQGQPCRRIRGQGSNAPVMRDGSVSFQWIARDYSVVPSLFCGSQIRRRGDGRRGGNMGRNRRPNRYELIQFDAFTAQHGGIVPSSDIFTAASGSPHTAAFVLLHYRELQPPDCS
jgi:hypothetical protein